MVYEWPGIKLFNADSRKLKKILKEEIDVTITSPPYFDMKDYDSENQIGFGQEYKKGYLKDLGKIFNVILKKTKETGSLWVIVDTFKTNGELQMLPFDLAKLISKQGWKLQDILIWDKKKTLPWSGPKQLRNIFEYILIFSKSKQFKFYKENVREPYNFKKWWVEYPERYHAKGKVPTKIWPFLIPTQGWGNKYVRHFCPFPPNLVERILNLTTDEGDIVLDPFAGSGIVLGQASCMKRKAIGIELNQSYVDGFQKVYDDLHKQWQTRLIEIQKRDKMQGNIESRINNLRQLKYVKLLTEIFIVTFDFLNKQDILVFAFSNGSVQKINGEKQKMSIYYVINQQAEKENMETKINEFKNKPALSALQIESEVKIMNREEFIKITPNMIITDLWMYRLNKFYLYYDSIIKEDILNGFQSNENIFNLFSKNLKFPIIISNIKAKEKIAPLKWLNKKND